MTVEVDRNVNQTAPAVMENKIHFLWWLTLVEVVVVMVVR